MHILLTNDDGIFAPALGVIYNRLTEFGRVTVAAPESAQSGASHSISLEPLSCSKVEITGQFDGYSVKGTPADCVNLAVLELLDAPVDLIVSGINVGANAGIHVHYSGTVAAAMEGAFCDIPAIAVSMVCDEKPDVESAVDYAIETIKNILPLDRGDVININIPKLSSGKPKGVKVVRHSTSGYHQSYSSSKDENGKTHYLYSHGPHRDECHADTDTNALEQGYISVTALHFDMTNHGRNAELSKIIFQEGG